VRRKTGYCIEWKRRLPLAIVCVCGQREVEGGGDRVDLLCL